MSVRIDSTFKILGPLRVRANGNEVAIAAARERTLLAMLLLRANSPVTADQLIDETWPERAPQNARRQLQRCMHRLRRLLADLGVPGKVIVTEPIGYRAAIGPLDLDLFEFRRLLAEGREAAGAGRYSEAVRTYRAAGALWSGPALAGVESNRLRQACAALDEEKAQTLEELFDAALAAGGAGELVPELTDLVRRHPHRERLHRSLMLALYRAGRQADALAEYRRLHHLLRDELGTEPGREVQELQKAILRRDPDLDPPRIAPRPAVRVPCELPADVPAFTGRVDALHALDTLASGHDVGPGAVAISVISGGAGVGKTALAVHWSHRAAGRFPDGQLFLDLRGHAASAPMRPVEALAVLLRSLGTAPVDVPADVDEAARRYRTLLAGRRVLVVLDNAGSADQVRPLLPGSPTCRVVVTSRDRLAGLVAREGAQPIRLGELAPAEARALLASVLGANRVGAEPDATAELARACGYLPLAIRIAAANLALDPDSLIAQHVDNLLSGDRLRVLQADGDEHHAVAAAFDLSYQRLSAEARRLFRMLALVPGSDVTVDGAAALAGMARDDVRRLMDRLAAAGLLVERRDGRHAFHDLVQLYAQRRSVHEDAEPERRAAVGRLLRWYLSMSDVAARTLSPRIAWLPVTEADAVPDVVLDGPAEAQRWFAAERANLVAAVGYAARHAEPRLAWQLADRIGGYLRRGRYLVDLGTVIDAALTAVESVGDLTAQAAIRTGVAGLHEAAGHYPAAEAEYLTAAALAERAGWANGHAASLVALAGVHWSQGQLQDAAGRLAQGLAAYRRTGWRAGEATVLTNLGNIRQELGQLREAFDLHNRALALSKELGLSASEAVNMHNLGETCYELGRFPEADGYLAQALSWHRQVGNRSGEAGTLSVIAALRRDQTCLTEALTLAQRAFELAQKVRDHRCQAVALNELGSVLVHLNRSRDALDCHTRALQLAQGTGDRSPHNRALLGLAIANHRLGDLTAASDHAQAALELANRAGYQVVAAEAMTVLAEIELARGRYEEAHTHAQWAIDHQRATGHQPGEARACDVLDRIRRARGAASRLG